jgi:hypothetical protein
MLFNQMVINLEQIPKPRKARDLAGIYPPEKPSKSNRNWIAASGVSTPVRARERPFAMRCPRLALRVEGSLQNQDGVINVRASAAEVLQLNDVDLRSHDFH